jgi:hypothetical protein
MDAMLATIVDGGRAIVVIYRDAGRNKLIYPLIWNFNTKPFECDLAQPLPQRRLGVGNARPTKQRT